MRKHLLTAICFLGCIIAVSAQNYPNIVNYSLNGTPTNGVKIKTNLPFLNSSQMPTISIVGYSYGLKSVIDIKISYYIFGGAYVNHSVSSSGNYTPKIMLGVENGKVILFIDDKVYFQRFTVSVYSKDVHTSPPQDPAWFQGWTVADETLAATNVVQLQYQNKFGENIYFNNGSVGIGASAIPVGYKLAVAGKIIAEELKVKPSVNWPDYVFDTSYHLRSLSDLEDFIKQNKHLPDVQSAKEVEEHGIEIGSNQAILLKKIEEQALYIIEQNNKIKGLEKRLDNLEQYMQQNTNTETKN